jgi:hypothetical protein
MDASIRPVEGPCVNVVCRRPGRARWREGRQAASGVLLGATLALGASGLVGCERDPRLDPKLPAVAAHPEPLTVQDEDAAPVAREEPAVTLALAPAFTPDPQTHEATTVGGPVDAAELGDGCQGWIGRDPDAVVDAERPFAELTVMVASAEAETTLVVRGPADDVRCGAGPGAHAALRGAFAQGRYEVWVGTREAAVRARYVLGISELDDRQPSQLLD